jgi:hypothetical protein
MGKHNARDQVSAKRAHVNRVDKLIDKALKRGDPPDKILLDRMEEGKHRKRE